MHGAAGLDSSLRTSPGVRSVVRRLVPAEGPFPTRCRVGRRRPLSTRILDLLETCPAASPLTVGRARLVERENRDAVGEH